MADYVSEADPRYSDKPPETSGGGRHGGGHHGGHHGGSHKKQPRVAFTGEEYGFGYRATKTFIERARRRGTVPDGGLSPGITRLDREIEAPSKNNRFDYRTEIPQPLRTKEAALMAVKQGTADFAIVPFYHPYAGYDFETLRALGSQFTLLAVDQVEETDNLCLAVHESQLYDLIQSAHPGTGFSVLQRRFRKSWGAVDLGSGNTPGGADYDAELPRAGLPIDMADQKLIRDRIDMVFAGPEAARRCKSKLDGLRAIGVEVKETPQMVEPHRELARLARSAVTTNRQTNTMFDPVTNKTHFVSTLGAEAQGGRLYGMVLPYEVAMRSSDYVIIDHKFDDAQAEKTRFLIVENNPDESLFEEILQTTDARTRYWFKRLVALASSEESLLTRGMHFIGGLLFAAGALALIGGGLGYFSALNGAVSGALAGLLHPFYMKVAALTGLAITLISFLFLSARDGGHNGVRLMLRFRRDGHAASIGDIEDFLRNYGVRHATMRLDEDSERDKPAAILLDIEFDTRDFEWNPLTMLTRRMRGSVANGALKKAFARWKDRGALVLAAMPFTQPQLPPQHQRRWYAEGLHSRIHDFFETMAVRAQQTLPPVLLTAFLIAAGLYAVGHFAPQLLPEWLQIGVNK